MKFFKLTKEKPSTGLMTIKMDDNIKVINISSNVQLCIEFSNTDGEKESMELIDEVNFQNNTSYLKRPYSRMEIEIADSKKLAEKEEVFCKVEILD